MISTTTVHRGIEDGVSGKVQKMISGKALKKTLLFLIDLTMNLK